MLDTTLNTSGKFSISMGRFAGDALAVVGREWELQHELSFLLKQASCGLGCRFACPKAITSRKFCR